MRVPPAPCALALVLSMAAAVHAEPPDASQRLVRTSLDAAPVPEFRSPPRLITASLDQRQTAVLGGPREPRLLRRSLEDGPAVASAASPASPVPSAAGAPSALSDAGALSAPESGNWMEGEGPSGDQPGPTAEAAGSDGAAAGFGALDCDCARTRRKIRLNLDGAATAAPEAARIIRVDL